MSEQLESLCPSNAAACSLPSSSGISFLPLGAFLDDRKPMRLLPFGWLTATLKPIVSGATRATNGGNNLGGGILGKLFREGHGRNVSRKNKSAMPKIILAIRRHCRHITWVSQPHKPMKTITSPKRLRQDHAESFRLEIIAIGGRWNNSYDYWMIPEGQEAAADAIRARYPDREFEKAPNQFCLDRR